MEDHAYVLHDTSGQSLFSQTNFQASLKQGQLPEYWKHANITPICKKGPQLNPTNYSGPISLSYLYICCKVLEHS